MARQNILSTVTTFKEFNSCGVEYKLPILYRRLDLFFAVLGANARMVKASLPSRRLKPIPIWPGRVAFLLFAANYIDTDIGPYGEFSAGAPCFLRHEGKVHLGVYVHRLPVTTEIARAAGVESWGFPKFLCEMDFKDRGDARCVSLSQNGESILDFLVMKGGVPVDRTMEAGVFTIKNGRIIFTKCPAQATARVNFNGLFRLGLGPHEMGRELSRFRLGPKALVTGDCLDVNMILPEGEDVGGVD